MLYCNVTASIEPISLMIANGLLLLSQYEETNTPYNQREENFDIA
jgi:hypothetical protein